MKLILRNYSLSVGTYSQIFSTDLVLVLDCPDQLVLATTILSLKLFLIIQIEDGNFCFNTLPYLLLTATVILSVCNIWTRSNDSFEQCPMLSQLI